MKKELEKILRHYIVAFSIKHGLEFEFAVSDDLLGVICFGDIYYFAMSDIVFDIDTDQPKGLILDWVEQSVEYQDEYINFQSYCKGARYNTLTKQSECVLLDFLKNSVK